MLPHFYSANQKLRERIEESIRLRSQEKSGAFNIPAKILFEGDQFGVIRDNGDEDISPLKKLEGSTVITKEDMSNNKKIIGETIDEIAEQFAKQQSSMILSELSKTPNQIDGKDKPLVDAILEALEVMLIDFDENGSAIMPTLVMNPVLFEKAKDIFVLADKDPKIKNKFDSLMERKKREWNDRESTRKLVD